MADLETEIKVTADVSGVESGVGKAKKSLADLGASAAKLGQDGAKGFTALGDSSGLAAGRLDTATRNMAGSVQRLLAQMEAGEKGSRKYFETLAAQRGANLDALRPLLDQLDAVKRKTEEAQRAQERYKAALSELRGAAAAAGAALAAVGVAAAYSFVNGIKGALEMADALNKLSQRSGIAVEALSQLQFAAKLSDVSAESLTTALRKLNANIAEGVAGNPEKVAVFKALGVNLKDAQGNAISADKALVQIANTFERARDGAGKTALAVAALGKAGDELIPLLNGGGDALEDMMKKADALGLTISADFARRAEEFNDNLTILQTSSQKLAISWGETLVPFLNDVVVAMQKATDQGGKLRGVLAGLDVIGNKLFDWEGNAQRKAIKRLEGELKDAQQRYAFNWFLPAEIKDKLLADVEEIRKKLQATRDEYYKLTDAAGAGRGVAKDPRQLGPVPSIAAQIKGPVELKAPAPAGASDAASAYEALIKRVQERIALQDEELKAGRQLTEQEKFDTKVFADLEAAKKKINATQAEEIKLALERSRVKALELQDRAQELTNAKQIAQQVFSEQQELAAFEKSRADQRDRINAAALEQKEALEDSRKILEAEASLIGATDTEREKAVETLKIELQLKRDIEKINRDLLLTEDARQKAIADKTANADEAKRQVAQRSILNEWQRTADSINQSLTDALLRGFESGKGFASNFRDTLKNMFKTLVLQPVIKAVLAPVSGTLAGIGQSIGQSITGGGGSVLGSVGNIANAGSTILGGTSIGNTIGTSIANVTWTGLDGFLATNGAFGTAGGALGAIGTALPYIGAALAIASLLGGSFKGETRSGGQYVNGKLVGGPSGGEINGDATRQAIAATQESVNAYLKALGSSQSVAYIAAGLESSKEGKGFAYGGIQLSGGAVVGQGIDGYGFQNRRGNKSEAQAAADFAEELKQVQLEAIAASDAVGPLADYVRSLGDISQLTGAQLDGAINKVTTALAQKQQLEDRLFDLTATDSEKLTRTRDRERASIDESNRALLDRIYALEDEKTAAEKAAEAMQKLKDAASFAYQGLQRSVDAQRKAVQAAYDATVQAVQPQIDSISKSLDKITGLANALDGTLSRYRTDEVTGIGRADATAQIQTAIAIAKASGTLPDAEDLQDALAVISQPNQEVYATLQEYILGRDREAATLGDLQGLTKGQLTVQERTLNALKDQLKVAEDVRDQQTAYLDQVLADAQAQLDALNGVNTSVLSVKDAILALNVALSAAGGGRVNVGGPAASFYASNPQANAPDPQGLAFWNDYAARNGTAAAQAEFDRTVEYLRNQHADGLWEVPYDGYRNTAHKGEAILPMPQAEAWRKQVLEGGSGSALAARVDVLIERIAALEAQMSTGNANTNLMATILRGSVEGQLSLKTST